MSMVNLRQTCRMGRKVVWCYEYFLVMVLKGKSYSKELENAFKIYQSNNEIKTTISH